MPSVLALGALSFEAYRRKVANFLADEDDLGRVIEVSLFNLYGLSFVMREWQPREDEDLSEVAEQIASYIVEHEGAGATIFVRRRDEREREGTDRGLVGRVHCRTRPLTAFPLDDSPPRKTKGQGRKNC
jgi:hypothetical protein